MAVLVEAYEDVCLLNGQGVDKPVPKALFGLVRTLDPKNGLLLLNQAKIRLRSQPKAAKAAPTPPPAPPAPAEPGKSQGPQPLPQPQPLKAEPGQLPTAPKSGAEAEPAVAAEPLTVEEVGAMLAMKPADAEVEYSAERLRATLVSLGTDAASLEYKTYRQLFNMTRNQFA